MFFFFCFFTTSSLKRTLHSPPRASLVYQRRPLCAPRFYTPVQKLREITAMPRKKACTERHPRSVYYANTVDGAGRTETTLTALPLCSPGSLFLRCIRPLRCFLLLCTWFLFGDGRRPATVACRAERASLRDSTRPLCSQAATADVRVKYCPGPRGDCPKYSSALRVKLPPP